ncbi:cAMP-dependent protein kinase inhibitor beta [Stegostoma tigrinum]|uniref:cAMP-dependent protein kinase inhibitor beta n=1 Tax=Stegostoma tigrinum TaxID=3053191 RepID=UPI00202ADB74|nr:cAMP-dependent protein kinase inhibitor beta [Stegostoma tigrinum]XP_059501724.1 cAMP-dependent protein kinase inhibitor beta [Stegostoma tigrinum]XP_059501725.1 cAMP-dependent protein kinase inhibitor beta [Stegostoma tigrinum]XP_059501726.1 cAMP-dependent protein kinase inhibitor beta [Stegostoma tigrinum]XP_059501727.1 cAMP-dependent protein kinase inhibitor beta [Stegostoma tigrinum]XP_059501728.1 cAMP-dependent protein kinase inhibitor beta [Stegostoma tigrinum]XP_059501729.1 cAMP-dep
MTDVEPGVTDFVSSGRAGRRNALPDILGSPAGVNSADLPNKLSELSINTDEGAEEKTSASEEPPKLQECEDKDNTS